MPSHSTARRALAHGLRLGGDLLQCAIRRRRLEAGDQPDQPVITLLARRRRIRRTVGSHASKWARTLSRCAASRLARTLRMASGSPARSPGLPPTRPRLRAARSPALVRSAISARSRAGRRTT